MPRLRTLLIRLIVASLAIAYHAASNREVVDFSRCSTCGRLRREAVEWGSWSHSETFETEESVWIDSLCPYHAVHTWTVYKHTHRGIDGVRVTGGSADSPRFRYELLLEHGDSEALRELVVVYVDEMESGAPDWREIDRRVGALEGR